MCFMIIIWPWPWFNPYPTGCIEPHPYTICVCQELPPLLRPRWTPSFAGLCSLYSSSSLLVDLVLSCILVSTCQYSACCGMHWWSIRKTCPSQRSHLSLSMLSMVCYPVLALTSTAVILSFQEMASCSSAVCGAQHLVFSLILLSTAIHKSALYRRFDRIIASYNLVFTCRPTSLLFPIFFILTHAATACPVCSLTSFSQLPLNDI